MNFMIALQEYSNKRTSTVFPIMTGNYYQRQILNNPATTIKWFLVAPEISNSGISFINKIQSYSKLQQNWDSYGADAPSNISIQNAIRFVRKIDKFNVIPYFTAPGPNGEIVIELKNGDSTIEIYFNPDNSEEVYFFIKDDCIREGKLDELFNEIIEFVYAN